MLGDGPVALALVVRWSACLAQIGWGGRGDVMKTSTYIGQSYVVKRGEGWGRSWPGSSTHHYDGEPLSQFITAWWFQGSWWRRLFTLREEILQEYFVISFASGTSIYSGSDVMNGCLLKDIFESKNSTNKTICAPFLLLGSLISTSIKALSL